MMDKQSLVIGLLIEKMADSKVGILAKGISDIQPAEIAVELSSQRKSHVYVAAVGYDISADVEEADYTLLHLLRRLFCGEAFLNMQEILLYLLKQIRINYILLLSLMLSH